MIMICRLSTERMAVVISIINCRSGALFVSFNPCLSAVSVKPQLGSLMISYPDPRLVRIAFGQASPKRDQLVPVGRTFPKRWFGGIAVGDIVVIPLAARRGVHIEDEVEVVGLAPGEQAIGEDKSFLQPGV